MVHPVAIAIVPIFVGLWIIRKIREQQWGYCDSKTSLSGKVFIVTGSNCGIGKATAKSLAKRDACVIMACRDLRRAQSAANEIRSSTTSGTLIPMHLDLASLHSVKKFAEEVLQSFPQIHVLINNAGVYVPFPSDQKTSDGHEMNFGVNHLGHFLLTNLLIKRIKDSSPSRIVVVSSGLHESGKIDIQDLNMEKRKSEVKLGRSRAGYTASKLANVYHARELAQQLKGSGVSVFAVCPGFTYTNLFRQSKIKWWQYIAFLPIAFLYMRSAHQGAQTILHCATSDDIESMSGQFFKNCKLYISSYNFSPDIQKQLWQKCEEITKNY